MPNLMNTKKNIFMNAKHSQVIRKIRLHGCATSGGFLVGGWIYVVGLWVGSLWWWLVMFEFGHGGY